MSRPLRIISGGQTGADRGGLDAAIALGIPHGGWCPKGRRAEDGVIPAVYELDEAPSRDYRVRTELNVDDANLVVIFTRGKPSGGSAETARIALRLAIPLLLVDLDHSEADAARLIREWVNLETPATLNVAGSRESKAPGIQAAVKALLVEAFA